MPKKVKVNKRVVSGGKRKVSAWLERKDGAWVVHHGLGVTKSFFDSDYKQGKAKRHAERYLAKVS